MKAKVTTQVDTNLKLIFESMMEFTNQGFQEALEKGIRQILIEAKNTQYLDFEAMENQAALQKLTEKQVRLEHVKEQLKNIDLDFIENKNNGNNKTVELESIRETRFLSSKDSIIKLWNKGAINWDAVVPGYQFNDKGEAMKWFRNRIEKDQENEKEKRRS